MVMTRSDLGDFQKQVSALNAQSQQVLAAKNAAVARQQTERAQQTFIANIDRIIGRVQKFDSEADVHLGRFPGAEERYRTITEKMTEYVAHERHLAANQTAAVARGQLSVAATQASIATDQLHNSVQQLETSLHTRVEPIAADATGLEQGCRAVVPPGDLTPAQADARTDACRRLFAADTPFRQKFEAVSTGVGHLEQTHAHKRSVRQELLRAAGHLQWSHRGTHGKIRFQRRRTSVVRSRSRGNS